MLICDSVYIVPDPILSLEASLNLDVEATHNLDVEASLNLDVGDRPDFANFRCNKNAII